ncbi:MAG: helix-turn-helix transcriptional regulator [Eubacteriaceae bacterium]|jgi:predicted transcriptional regulator YheO
MTVPEKLKPYVHLVDFLADFLGENTEVVLHNMTDWHQSVVAIRNGYISGRRVGAPLTDYALDLMRSGSYKDKDYQANYKGASIAGHELRSATYYIKDDDGSLIGMLCLNLDCRKLMDARRVLDSLISAGNVEETSIPVKENFNIDVNDLVRNNIRNIYPDGENDLSKLSKEQKIDLVKRLEDMGTFMVKGAVWHVAEILGVSVSTVYRYLGNIKKNHEQGLDN